MNFAICRPVCRAAKTLASDGYKQVSSFKRHYHDRYLTVCIERTALKACELTDIEKRFSKNLEEIEFENSLKSDFELKEEAEAKKTVEKTEGGSLQSVKDFTDMRLKELETLKVYPKSAEEAEDKNVKSIKRKCTESIYLVTKQNIGTKQEVWLPPMDVINEGETIKSAAKRIVHSICGENSKIIFYGNAPFHYDKLKLDDDKSKDKKTPSKKVFYYAVRYISGPEIKKDIQYQWLNTSELKNTIPTFTYNSMLNSLLMCTEKRK